MRAAGDPVSAYLQNPEKATEQQIRLIEIKYHLNEPEYVQYWYWLKGVGTAARVRCPRRPRMPSAIGSNEKGSSSPRGW